MERCYHCVQEITYNRLVALLVEDRDGELMEVVVHLHCVSPLIDEETANEGQEPRRIAR